MTEQKYCIWVFLTEGERYGSHGWANTCPAGETDLDFLERTVRFARNFHPGTAYRILPIEENPNDR